MRMSANTAPELLAMAAMSIPDAGTVAVQDTEVAGDEDQQAFLFSSKIVKAARLSLMLAQRARMNDQIFVITGGARWTRARPGSARLPSRKRKRKSLARLVVPSRVLSYKAALGERVVLVPLEAVVEWNCAL
jgi:hypothetical protein